MLAEAAIAIVIVLVKPGSSITDFQRTLVIIGGVCASFGILAMGSSRKSISTEIAAERVAMTFRRPRPPGDASLRRAMFLFAVSSALVALVGGLLSLVLSP